MAEQEKEIGLWYGILDTALKLPGAKVERDSFLEKEFAKYANEGLIKQLVEAGIGKAGIPLDVLDKVADGSIGFHTTTVTATSFAAGLPGGIAMAGTIPADLAQYYYHVIIVAQKLAYIYGWPNLEGDSNDDFLAALTILIGVMSGASEATGVLSSITSVLAREESSKRLPMVALAKAGLPQVAKQVARVLGANLAKQGLAKGIGKIIPIVGGAISAGATIVTFLPMANTLKNELRKTLVS